MRELKLVNCRLKPRWVFVPPQQVCEAHVMAAEKALQPRRAWLEAKAKSC